MNSFRPRPSDVFVVTYPKSGTTWMTQICQMLRRGDINFGKITEVCPWDARAAMSGQQCQPSKGPQGIYEPFSPWYNHQGCKLHLCGPQPWGCVGLFLPLFTRNVGPWAKRHHNASICRFHLHQRCHAIWHYLGSYHELVQGQRWF